MERNEAMAFMVKLLKNLLNKGGSDLFITAGFPPAIKIKGVMTPLTDQPLTANDSRALTQCIMNDKQLKEFEETQECNFAIAPAGLGRFRVNAYFQQCAQGLVLRVIAAEIPNFEKLGLPPVLKDVMMYKNGLIIMVGGTGSGKSTSLAAMIDYRNENSKGHIITLEDPIEYVHKHKNCVVMQRSMTHRPHTKIGNRCRHTVFVVGGGGGRRNWADATKATRRHAVYRCLYQSDGRVHVRFHRFKPRLLVPIAKITWWRAARVGHHNVKIGMAGEHFSPTCLSGDVCHHVIHRRTLRGHGLQTPSSGL